MSTYLQKPARAFTLIELLLYVSLLSIMLFATSLFMQAMLEARVKNQVIGEVEQQGTQALSNMTQIMRNALSITAPGVGATSSSLTLSVMAPNDPTVFSLSSGALVVSEGGGANMALTNSRVSVSGLTFQNLTRPNTPGVLHVELTLTYVSTLSNFPYTYSKTFSTGASLRFP